MSGAVFATLEDWPDIVAEKKPNLAEELCNAIFCENYSAAYGVLRRLNEPLSGARASECLFHALSCTPRLFGEILERCEPGEYAWIEEMPYPWLEDLLRIDVSGTILTLAAAMDRPQHMELLLEAGWDVNSATPASEQALWDIPKERMPSGRNDGGIFVRNRNDLDDASMGWKIKRVTPLAAAIVCGGEKAVRTLLRCEGVKKLESAAVQRAGIVALHGSPEQRACLRLALGLKSGADDRDGMTRELLCGHALDVVAIADLCTPDEWALRLDAAPCPLERLRAAAKVLLEEHTLGVLMGSDEKLSALLERFPELGREQEIRDGLLNVILARMVAKQRCETLLKCWKTACGGTRDLTGAEDDVIDDLGALTAGRLRSILSKLGEGGMLRAAAESDWFAERMEDRVGDRLLDACLDSVDVYRATGGGASALAEHLLRRGNVRLLRKAAARGALRGESKEELLALLGEEKKSTTLRALVLTLPDGQVGVASARPQPKDAAPWRRWKEMDQWNQYAFLRKMWEKPLRAETCRKRLLMKEQDKAFDDYFLWYCNDVDGMSIDSLSAAACCGRNPELLRVLVEDGIADPKKLLRGDWINSAEAVHGTMLCVAAAAGRTEQVRLLLDMGLDPNEDDVPRRSTFYTHELFGTAQVVTPLYMALSKGHLETAELLRERGGYAYPDI